MLTVWPGFELKRGRRGLGDYSTLSAKRRNSRWKWDGSVYKKMPGSAVLELCSAVEDVNANIVFAYGWPGHLCSQLFPFTCVRLTPGEESIVRAIQMLDHELHGVIACKLLRTTPLVDDMHHKMKRYSNGGFLHIFSTGESLTGHLVGKENYRLAYVWLNIQAYQKCLPLSYPTVDCILFAALRESPGSVPRRASRLPSPSWHARLT